MRTVFYTLLIFSLALGANAQIVDTANTPLWIEMMQDPEANFFETQKAFEKYWQGREPQKGDGWKVFKRWEWYWEQRVDADGNFPPADQSIKAYENWRIAQNQSQSGIESESGTWTEIGPRFKPSNGTGQPNGNGRLNYVEFHPTNANILWVGSASGGFWKTNNGGLSWTTTTDNMPTLGVSSIAVDPNNANTIYIGTGDRDAGDAPGLGVYKSTNGGLSFNVSNTSMGNKTVGELLIHPTNSNYLLAATSGGIYRSQNGGSSWTLESGNYNFKDVKFNPGNPSIVYATETTSGAGFWRSTDGGDTWTEITTGLPASPQRYSIGVSEAAEDVVYIVCSISSAYGGLYRSNNAGLSFTTQSTEPNILTWNEVPPSTGGGGQGWYDLAIAVDPSDEDIIYVGGVNIFKSVNAGATWDCVAHWVGSSTAASVHADHHWLKFSPVNDRLYNCNDGGLYYTANGGYSWPEVSDSLGVSQIYKIGVSQNTHALVINGYQDNGTAIWDNTEFRTERGGDGMECIIDPSNDNIMYATVYYGNIARSTNAGYSFGSFAANNVNGITESGGWVTPYILHKDNPQMMFIGYKNVWRTSNAYAATPTFTAISNNLGGSNSSNMRQLRQSKVNGNRLYALRSDNTLYRSDNATAVNPSWVDLSSYLPSGYHIADIETSPQHYGTVWIIRSNIVYKSTNGGTSWTSISANLPPINKNCLVADPYSDGGLYLGTDAGVYYTDNTMSTWISFDDGLPATAEITELEIYHVEGDWQARRLRAGTYGRGLWESDLYDPGDLAPMAFGSYSISGSGTCTPGTITLTSTSAYGVDSLHWGIYPPNGASFVNGTNANSNPAQITFSQGGTYDVVLYVENANGVDSVIVLNNFVVDLPVVTLSADQNYYCEGDTATITATSGFVSYNFYKNGVLYQVGSNNTVYVYNLAPGDSVSVDIEDENGCYDTGEINLNVWPAPTSNLVSDEGTEICQGDTVIFTNVATGIIQHDFYVTGVLVQSGTSNNYVTDSLMNGHIVEVKNTDANGCTGNSNQITMNVLPTPATPVIIWDNDSLYASASGEFFQWKLNDTLTGNTGQHFSQAVNGLYSVRLYKDGCWSAWSDTLRVTGVSIATLLQTSFRLYPNPSQDFIVLETSSTLESSFNLWILDMSGRTVMEPRKLQAGTGYQHHIDLSKLAGGMYQLVIESNQRRITLAVIKENQ